MSARGNIGKLGARRDVTRGTGIRPVPAAVDGRRWVVRESTPHGPAYVERHPGQPGTMVVPMGDTPADRRVRVHEMAHVRWTPDAPIVEGATWKTVNACEDRRMARRLIEVGLGHTLDAPLWELHDPVWQVVGDRLTSSDPQVRMTAVEVAQLIVATDLCWEAGPVRELLRETGWQWAVQVTDGIVKQTGIGKRRPAWKTTVETAQEIERVFREIEELDEGLREALTEAGNQDPDDVLGDDEDPGWGQLLPIRVMPLTVPLPVRMRRPRPRATDAGAIPRNWHRLPIDQRVFSRSPKRPAGGTVLIDQSGSMSLDSDQVQALIEAFPAVTIATYAGDGEVGELRIIARKGRRASDEDCLHPWGNNVVDGPALDWLLTQPAPRVWVSDGRVTGRREAVTAPLQLDAIEKVRRGNVVRVGRLGELLPQRREGRA